MNCFGLILAGTLDLPHLGKSALGGNPRSSLATLGTPLQLRISYVLLELAISIHLKKVTDEVSRI